MYILGYTWYIHCHGYTMYMPGIYHVYTIHMDDISIWMVYTRYIPGIYQKSGFQMWNPGVKSNKNTVTVQTRPCIYLSYTSIYWYIPVTSWYILSHTSYILNHFFMCFGKFLRLESVWMHAPYTLHGVLESEIDKSLLRQ